MRTLNITRMSLFIKSYNLLVLLGLVYEGESIFKSYSSTYIKFILSQKKKKLLSNLLKYYL